MLGLVLVQMSSMRDALSEALLELGSKDPRIVVLGADTSVSIKTSLFADRYPDRFFNVGIAEANMIGIAAGLAWPVRYHTSARTRHSSPGNVWTRSGTRSPIRT